MKKTNKFTLLNNNNYIIKRKNKQNNLKILIFLKKAIGESL